MDNIGKVFYINLDKRVDRKVEFETQIETYFSNIKDKVDRYPAIYNTYGLLGCTMSHLAVVKHIKQLKHLGETINYAIIFEDDFQFTVAPDIFKQSIDKLFTLVDVDGFDFKVVMLAYNAMNWERYNDLLDKTTNVQTSSVYLINFKYLDELIECWESGLKLFIDTKEEWLYCNDQYWKKIQNEKWYLFKPRLGIQRPSFSDCSQTFVDHKC